MKLDMCGQIARRHDETKNKKIVFIRETPVLEPADISNAPSYDVRHQVCVISRKLGRKTRVSTM